MIDKDVTAKKHDAAIENANAQKEELRVRTTNLQEKIQHGEWMRALKEHPGFQLIEAGWQKKYPYEAVVKAYTEGGVSKEVDKVIFGRAAIDETYKTISFIEQTAKMASTELEREEQSK